MMIRVKWPHVHSLAARHAAFEKNTKMSLFMGHFGAGAAVIKNAIMHPCPHPLLLPGVLMVKLFTDSFVIAVSMPYLHNYCPSIFATRKLKVKAGQLG